MQKVINLKSKPSRLMVQSYSTVSSQEVRNQSRKSKKQNTLSTGPEDFKTKLDMFLSSVPDQPRIDGLSPGVETNSLLHQTKRGQGGGQLPISGA